jgi:hypothetical protein
MSTLISEWLKSKVVSSAKSRDKKFEHTGRSLIYIRNKMGPKIEPWGTPMVISDISLKESLIATYCFLPNK